MLDFFRDSTNAAAGPFEASEKSARVLPSVEELSSPTNQMQASRLNISDITYAHGAAAKFARAVSGSPTRDQAKQETPFSARLSTQSFMPAVATYPSPRNEDLVRQYAEDVLKDNDANYADRNTSEPIAEQSDDRAIAAQGRYDVTRMMQLNTSSENAELPFKEQTPRDLDLNDNDTELQAQEAPRTSQRLQASMLDPKTSLKVETAPTMPSPRHPLEGVPNYKDLPEPEPLLSEQSENQSNLQALSAVFGEYRTRCIFSKVFALREAVAQKVSLMLRTHSQEIVPLRDCLSEVCSLIRILATDKIHQVLMRVMQLTHDVLDMVPNTGLKRASIMPVLDPVLAICMDRMADGNHRIREMARIGVDAFVLSPAVGPLTVSIHTLRAMQSNDLRSHAWRPLVARLQLLKDLVDGFGLDSAIGLSLDTVMAFPRDNGCFSHPNGEVRDAAKDLTTAVERRTGPAALTSYLNLLRPKQLEEYKQAFDKMARDAPRDTSKVSAQGPYASGVGLVQPKMSPRSGPGKPGTHAPKNTAGHVGTSAARALARESYEENDAIGANNSTGKVHCMFCGAGDRNWTEDTLDMHYWKDCPLLAPCPACAQVLEVAGLTDHLLDECEHKGSYVHCKTTGLAVRKQDYAAFKKGPYFHPVEQGAFLCPLCFSPCVDTDADWNRHLRYECAQNIRIIK